MREVELKGAICMKKVITIILTVFLSLLVLSACNSSKSGSTNSEGNVSYSEKSNLVVMESEYITTDAETKMAYFDDGTISFSWEMDQWHADMYNGIPMLGKIFDGTELTCVILAEDSGVPSDLGEYAVDALSKYYNPEDDPLFYSNILVSSIDKYYTAKGYYGITTGYYNISEKFSEETDIGDYSVVHVVTNGKCSAVIGLMVHGTRDNMLRVENECRAGETRLYLENQAESVLNSFVFSNGTRTKLTRFTYADAKTAFPYDGQISYSEYKDNIISNVEELKTEVLSLHDQIIQSLWTRFDELTAAKVRPLLEKDDFKERYIDSYEEYYQEIMKAAERAEQTYDGLSELKSYPANSAGEGSALWKYVVYENILDELQGVIAWLDE